MQKIKRKKSNCLELKVCFLISFASSFETSRSGCRRGPDQQYARLFSPILGKYSSSTDVVGDHMVAISLTQYTPGVRQAIGPISILQPVGLTS